MRNYALLKVVLLLIVSVSNVQALTIYDLVDKELLIDDGFAGQSITIKNINDSHFVCHTVFGSGVPVISEKIYPVVEVSEKKAKFIISSDHYVLFIEQNGTLAIFKNKVALTAPIFHERGDFLGWVSKRICVGDEGV